MYRNLYTGEVKGQIRKKEYVFQNALIFCILIGTLFLTGYENNRIIQKISSELQEESFLGETAGRNEERKIRIVLDAGHGGRDTGSFCEGIYEKDINDLVVRDLKRFLESMGAEVILTGDGDAFVSEYKRMKEANAGKADLFISIHCGCSIEDEGASGMGLYYAENGCRGMEYADALAAGLRQEAVVKCGKASREGLYVLENVRMPAILIKLGSLSDPWDGRNLKEAACREQMSWKLAKSIMQLF